MAGPLPKDGLEKEFKEGNCRLAVQIYFYKIHNVYFKPEKILNPNGYKNTGKFVFTAGEEIDFNTAAEGDVIYGENIVNKKGESINRGRETFNDEDEWILHFHTAVYLGNNQIWHATHFAGTSCFWTVDQFKKFYKPIALKRFLI